LNADKAGVQRSLRVPVLLLLLLLMMMMVIQKDNNRHVA
jgi:hypothetical protein